MSLSVAPSGDFEGNDGPWSTFLINIGTPAQQMRVLPASSQSSIWVVLQQGCPTQYPANCADLRGGIFQPSTSVSWFSESSDGNPYFVLPFSSEEALPNYTANGEVGFDTATIGTTAALLGQLIAGYAAPNRWLGILGLSGRPSHITDLRTSQDSPLQTLVDNKTVSVSYWAYTAGARYTDPQTLGSLAFGGYNAARVNTSTALEVSKTMGRTLSLD